MNAHLTNLASVVAAELRAQMVPGKRLYKTGNMKRSVAVITIDDKTVDVVIATDYASYTDERGRYAGWVQQAASKAIGAYCTAQNVEDLTAFGMISPSYIYGG